MDQEKDLNFAVTKKFYLLNFLNYFEIFFNEIKKLELACGYLEGQGIEATITSLKVERETHLQNLEERKKEGGSS
jgi:hypothetical protein